MVCPIRAEGGPIYRLLVEPSGMGELVVVMTVQCAPGMGTRSGGFR